MSDKIPNPINDQVEKLFVGPVRTYAGLTLDHFEKLLATQFEATRAYTEVGLSQVRAALNITDTRGFQAYIEGQQQVAKDLGDRFKGDAEKFAALNQEFVTKAQKLTEDNIKTASRASTQAK